MGGAVGFDGQTGQQQKEDKTEDELLLFCQEVHGGNVNRELGLFNGNGISRIFRA
jgi:hypothetical protein